MIRPERRWLLSLSVLIALLFGLLPLPSLLQPLKPYWLLLTLAFWMIETPARAGLGLAFSLGLIADIAFGSLALSCNASACNCGFSRCRSKSW